MLNVDSKKFLNMNNDYWNRIISRFSSATILQTWEWGQIKCEYGWEPDYFIRKNLNGDIEAASLILSREQRLSRFGPALRILYLPHGPLVDWTNGDLVKEVLNDLVEYAKAHKAVYLKIDPQTIFESDLSDNYHEQNTLATGLLSWMSENNWRCSNQQIQFKNTFWIDLSPSEEELLSGMKQKTRYNIRLAERKGVTVKAGGLNDLDLLYEMYAETSNRDGFIIRPRAYYQTLWGKFINAGMAVPLIARFQGTPIAALILFYFNKKSYYLYGMSRDLHREKMPNYLLQWEAIKTSKRLGCTVYDLWGAPDNFNERDRMWGVYRFKEGLGGKVIKTAGAFDYPTSQFTYKIIQGVLPVVQNALRSLRRKQIREELK